MTHKEQNKILDDKIKANKRQYDLDRKNAEISAYSSGDLPKYEYLTKTDLGYKPNLIEQTKFEYSPLGRVLNQGLDKSDKNKGILRRLKDIENKTSNQLLAIEDTNRLAIKGMDDNDDELYKRTVNNYKNNIINYKKLKDNLDVINKKLDFYKKNKKVLKNYSLFENYEKEDKKNSKILKRIISGIHSGKIKKRIIKNTTNKTTDVSWINDSRLFNKISKDVTDRYRKENKSPELLSIQSFLDDIDNEDISNKKDVSKYFKNFKNIVKSDELKDIVKELERAIFGYDDDENGSSGSRLKILSNKQMLSRLPILLAQIQAGNNSKLLKNEIRQILYSLHRSEVLTKTVYNNLIKVIRQY